MNATPSLPHVPRCKAEVGQALRTEFGSFVVDNRAWVRTGHTMTQVRAEPRQRHLVQQCTYRYLIQWHACKGASPETRFILKSSPSTHLARAR